MSRDDQYQRFSVTGAQSFTTAFSAHRAQSFKDSPPTWVLFYWLFSLIIHNQYHRWPYGKVEIIENRPTLIVPENVDETTSGKKYWGELLSYATRQLMTQIPDAHFTMSAQDILTDVFAYITWHNVTYLDLKNTFEQGPHSDIAPISIPFYQTPKNRDIFYLRYDPLGKSLPRMSDSGSIVNVMPLFSDPNFLRAMRDKTIPYSAEDLLNLLSELRPIHSRYQPFKNIPAVLVCCLYFPTLLKFFSEEIADFTQKISGILQAYYDEILRTHGNHNALYDSTFWKKEQPCVVELGMLSSEKETVIHQFQYVTHALTRIFPLLIQSIQLLPHHSNNATGTSKVDLFPQVTSQKTECQKPPSAGFFN